MDNTHPRIASRDPELCEVLEIVEEFRKQRTDGTAKPAPCLTPGFLLEQLPDHPPADPEPWHEILHDVREYYMKGLPNSTSPYYFAYMSMLGSKASGLASMIQETTNTVSAKWDIGMAGVELEVVVMDWITKSLGLPQHFLHGGAGGGTLVPSSSEGELMSMCAARNKKIQELLASDPSLSPHDLLSKLVVYSSQETHPNGGRACRLLMLRHHVVRVDRADNLALTGPKLRQAMLQDREEGLIPFMVIATLGTTATCAFDNLKEIGPVCAEFGCWLHVDAAYAGTAFLCPEFRHYLEGIEHVDSFCVNFYKWMNVSIGCSGFWLKNASYLTEEFTPSNAAKYLTEENSDPRIPAFYKWRITVTAPCKGLQMWFVIRSHGISGLQKHIRNNVAMAQYAASLLRKDPRFSITHPPAMGIVCFKLKDQPDSVNKEYVKSIQRDERLYLMGTSDPEGYFVRLCVLTQDVTRKHMDVTVSVLRELSDRVTATRKNSAIIEVTAPI